MANANIFRGLYGWPVPEDLLPFPADESAMPVEVPKAPPEPKLRNTAVGDLWNTDCKRCGYPAYSSGLGFWPTECSRKECT